MSIDNKFKVTLTELRLAKIPDNISSEEATFIAVDATQARKVLNLIKLYESNDIDKKTFKKNLQLLISTFVTSMSLSTAENILEEL